MADASAVTVPINVPADTGSFSLNRVCTPGGNRMLQSMNTERASPFTANAPMVAALAEIEGGSRDT